MSSYSRKPGSCFVVDPATGELVVHPDAMTKIDKAIMREVRRMRLRLQFTIFRLYLEKLALDFRRVATRIRLTFHKIRDPQSH